MEGDFDTPPSSSSPSTVEPDEEDEYVRGCPDLLAARETTSLWRQGGSQEPFIATFEEAEHPQMVRYGDKPYDVNPSSIFMHIQLVKRRDGPTLPPKYVVVIDGMQSNGVVNNASRITRHEICTHRAWTFDEKTKQKVVSPCAISILLEDGERPPERCELSVYANPFSFDEESLISSTLLEPYKIAGNEFVPVVAAYPTLYPPPAKLIIKDYSRVIAQNRENYLIIADRIKEFVLKSINALTSEKAIETLAKWAGANVALKGSITAISQFFGFGLTNGLFQGLGLSALSFLASSYGMHLGGLALYALARAFMASPSNTNWFGTDSVNFFVEDPFIVRNLAQFTKSWSKGTRDAVAAAANIRVPSQQPPDASGSNSVPETPGYIDQIYQVMAGLGDKLYDISEFVKDLPGVPKYEVQGPTPGSGDGEKLSNLVGQSVFAIGIYATEFLQRSPLKEPVEHAFSVREFANSLNRLAFLKREEIADRATDYYTAKGARKIQTKFKTELLVWKWLQEPEDDGWADFLKRVISNPLKAKERTNPLDFSECEISTSDAISLKLRVRVEDYEICKDGSFEEHEFECTREDAAVLGAVATKHLEDIEMVRDAISNLKTRIDDAINAKLPEDTKMWDQVDAWYQRSYFSTLYDRFFFDPLMELLKFRTESDTKRISEVKMLLKTRTYKLKMIKKNIERKLDRHFSNALITSKVERFFKQARDADVSKLNPKSCKVPAAYLDLDSPQEQKDPEPIESTDEFFDKLDFVINEFNLVDTLPNPAPQELTTAMWSRSLPHRATKLRFFYPRIEISIMDSIEIRTDDAIVDQISSTSRSLMALNSHLTKLPSAVRNIHENALAMTRGHSIVHAYSSDGSAFLRRPDEFRNVEFAFALQLQPPSDVLQAISYNTFTEGASNRVLAITQPGKDALGLPADWYHGIALQVYGQLLVNELVSRHCQAHEWPLVVFSAVKRASDLAVRCSDFLRTELEASGNTFLHADDPSLLSTATGRAAQTLLKQLHVVGGHSGSISRCVRLVAGALKRVALRVGDKKPAVSIGSIPVAPLASMFAPLDHGRAAHKRVRSVLSNHLDEGGAALAVTLCAAAYPVLQLNTSPSSRWVGDPSEDSSRFLPHPETIVPSGEALENVRSMLARRFAAMQTDFEASQTAESIVKMADRMHPGSFFVPYGHGNRPYPFSYPSSSVPMFETVPLGVSNLLYAIDLVGKGFARYTSAQERASDWDGIDLLPCFADCQNYDDAYNIDDPSMIVYSEERTIRFFASAVTTLKPTEPVSGVNYLDPTESGRAQWSTKHVQAASNSCSSIAWNAERVLQCMLLASASGKKDVDVHLPPSPQFQPIEVNTVQLQATEGGLAKVLNDIRFHARYSIYTLREVLKTMFEKANNLFTEYVSSRIENSGAPFSGGDLFDAIVHSDGAPRRPSNFAHGPATGAEPDADVDPITLMLKLVKNIDDAADEDLKTYVSDSEEYAKSFMKHIEARGAADWRQLLADYYESFEPIANGCIFSGEGKRYVNPRDFTYSDQATTGPNTETLEDLSVEEKRRLVKEALTLRAAALLVPHLRALRRLKKERSKLEEKIAVLKRERRAGALSQSPEFLGSFMSSVCLATAMCIDLIGEEATPSIRWVGHLSSVGREDAGPDATRRNLSHAAAGEASDGGMQDRLYTDDPVPERLKLMSEALENALEAVPYLRFSEACAIMHAQVAQ